MLRDIFLALCAGATGGAVILAVLVIVIYTKEH